ncbi:ATP-dependent Clp protease proteolytic subunit [Hymenobacter sp. 15J16-1T3B]|uniref:ATP-dependent Clp protease proteolytic subunit n=1 Tax=Hymenobacter sp. 15J16-1T3B TaxID=2886941 RepID=UPI001D0FE0F8|nr:ATP-dependent Clp protease proteolytic subunit [Hymenobacter sp. 15J16-1T3B]MCC3159510.1 ATP-dependent Clp protease proteolytic subunit [Hymenobacter sp. 15J16-1T3B]
MERTILIFDAIDPQVATLLDAQLSQWEQSGARTCTVRINSPGGSWMAGQLMRARMLQSKLVITTVNEGLVGSAATLVFAGGTKRQSQAHAKFMMHQVSAEVGGNVKALEQALNAQKALNRSTAEMYAAASTKKTEEWEQMMEAETWLSADEARAMGFVTEVLPAQSGVAAPEATMAAADMHRYYMSLIPQTAEMKLEDVKNALAKAGVKLADNATEADVLAALEKVQNQAPAAPAAKPATPPAEDEDELTRLRRENQQLKAQQTNDLDARATELVTNAVNLGKITASQKDGFLALAKTDYTNTASILAGMQARTSVAGAANGAAANGAANARNDWGFKEWSQKDSAGLLKMKQTEPEKYNALLTAYTG